MSLWKIAWRSIQQRGLASALTMISMALGVMLVVTVLSVHGVVAESFRNNSSLGYGLIVGAKGGKLQLTLNTVYYLSTPVENIPYDYYLEFRGDRAEQMQLSLAAAAHDLQWQSAAAACRGTEALAPLASTGPALARALWRQAEHGSLELEREGKYAAFIKTAIPVCLGDYVGRFRAVGTTPDMFTELRYGVAADRAYAFAEGRNFRSWSDEHGYFEAVVGAAVAREMGFQLGDEISPSHGDPEGTGHAQKFTVVGILAPTGTPNDRAVFINIEGFYLMDDHAKQIEEPEETPLERPPEGLAALAPPRRDGREPLPIEQREVTAVLLRTINPFIAVSLPNTINEGPVAQCVAPIREITVLFDSIVGPIQAGLLGLTAMICIVSGISILVSIYNSMSDRRQEIAVMRALGANRGTVMAVVLLESILLSLAGGLIGWVGGHSINVLAAGEIEARTGVSVGFFTFAPPLENVEFPVIGPIIGWASPELFLIPLLILLAILVGFLPAMSAYKTDVAKSLGV